MTTPPEVKAGYLAHVRTQAGGYATMRESLESAVRVAHDRGCSFRDIATAAGMSHEWVRRVCQRTIA